MPTLSSIINPVADYGILCGKISPYILPVKLINEKHNDWFDSSLFNATIDEC